MTSTSPWSPAGTSVVQVACVSGPEAQEVAEGHVGGALLAGCIWIGRQAASPVGPCARGPFPRGVGGPAQTLGRASGHVGMRRCAGKTEVAAGWRRRRRQDSTRAIPVRGHSTASPDLRGESAPKRAYHSPRDRGASRCRILCSQRRCGARHACGHIDHGDGEAGDGEAPWHKWTNEGVGKTRGTSGPTRGSGRHRCILLTRVPATCLAGPRRPKALYPLPVPRRPSARAVTSPWP